MERRGILIGSHETALLSFQPDFPIMVKAQFLSTAVWSVLFLTFYIAVFIVGESAALFPFLAELTQMQLFSYGLLAAVALGVALMAYIAFHIWILGEVGGWEQLKDEPWMLTDHALYLSHPEEAEEGFLPLHAIHTASKHFLFSIRLQLENKQSVVLRCLGNRNSVYSQITIAMEKAHRP